MNLEFTPDSRFSPGSIRLDPGPYSRPKLFGMRSQVALVISAVAASFVVGCDRRSSPTPAPPAEVSAPTASSKLGDLSTSLAAAREAFNARKGAPRFLSLLSPT